VTSVVLVEDNDMNRDMIARRLSNQGYQVHSAENAQDGLQTIRDSRPDLVLMDLSLPDRDGRSVTEELKNDPDTQAIPIVAITAHATKQERDQALDAGCEAYESKPIDFDHLLDKMQSVLDGESG
jgi:two-component system cell cycle response regulator DivK